MSELLLGIVFIIAMLVVVYGFYFLPVKIRAYLRIACGLTMLVLVWFASESSRMSIKIILTAVVLASLLKARSDLRKKTT